MKNKHSQLKAYKALMIASLKSILKSPSAIAFSIGFPLIFIFAFTFLDNHKTTTFNFGINSADTHQNKIYQQLQSSPHIRIEVENNDSIILKKLNNNKWTGYLQIDKTQQPALTISYSPESQNNKDIIESYLSTLINTYDPTLLIKDIPNKHNVTKTIDFILPGQLGFAILAASVFGTAFLFYNLRVSLVLKRFFTTPIKKINIILAECTARVIIQLGAAIFIILVGYFWLDFTLLNGWTTFVNMVLLCLIGLFTFMSYGFIISGIAKSESLIPPLANIVTLPQFILAGSFFPIDNLPKWIQYISNILPLTHFNSALRAIANDGQNLWDVKVEIIILLIWGIISYFFATKTFKWTP